jgi:hypothetical protein
MFCRGFMICLCSVYLFTLTGVEDNYIHMMSHETVNWSRTENRMIIWKTNEKTNNGQPNTTQKNQTISNKNLSKDGGNLYSQMFCRGFMICLCSVYLFTLTGVEDNYIHMMSVSFNSRTSVGRSYVAVYSTIKYMCYMSYFPLRGTKQFPLLQCSVKITYILFPNTVENYHVVTPCEFSVCYTIHLRILSRFICISSYGFSIRF